MGTKLFEKRFPEHRSTFKVRDLSFGEDFLIIAGPCAVEDGQSLMKIASHLQDHAEMLRGGLFKARTSPYSFMGLGEEGLPILKRAVEKHSLPVLVEFLEADQINSFSSQVDMIQIGTRNMFNYLLLKAAALSGKPILLKRHFAATIDELLFAAEYILELGNNNLALCERGIRTFENRYRNCLDLSAVVVLKQMTHLPIIVDPSHAAGDSSMVEKLALAAVCSGADGIMLEVHENPVCALSDAAQAIFPSQLKTLREKIEKLRSFMY